jgi:hypothetical protein
MLVGVFVLPGSPFKVFPHGQITCAPFPSPGNWSTVNATLDNSSVDGAPSTLYIFHNVSLEFQFRSSGSNPPSSLEKLTVAWGRNWTNSTTLVGNGCVPTYANVNPPGETLTVAYAGPYQRACGCGDNQYYADAYVAWGNMGSTAASGSVSTVTPSRPPPGT